MKIHQLSVADAFASLKSGPQGLDDAEAIRRLNEYGGNEVEEVSREPLSLKLLKEFIHFFALNTGESLPVSRDAEPCDEPDAQRSRNTLLAGTSLVSGEARALVFATGAHSAFGQLARLTQETGDTVSPLQREIIRVSRIVTVISLMLGASFFLIGQAIGISFWGNRIFGTAPISINVWIFMLPFAVTMIAMEELRKWVFRKVRGAHLQRSSSNPEFGLNNDQNHNGSGSDRNRRLETEQTGINHSVSATSSE